MNQWNSEYAMNQFNMPINPMMSNMMQYPAMYGAMADMSNQGAGAVNPDNAPLIGPVIPEGFINQDNIVSNQETQREEKPDRSYNKSSRYDSRKDRDGPRDRSRRRSRSRDRSDRRDRNERSRHSRRSKWDDPNSSGLQQGMSPQEMPAQAMLPQGMANQVMASQTMVPQGMGNMMMPGVMSYNNMMAQPVDMQNMQTMSGMNMMNMMPGMVDQNMVMMQMSNQNQMMYITNAVLLPPLPGIPTPNRREKPPGCRTIFIGGLPSEVKEDTVQEIFQRFGDISNITLHNQGVCHVRFEKPESVEAAFCLTGCRFRYNDQMDNEATTIFVDYALNRDDQAEYERNQRRREPTPPRVEPYSPAALVTITEKIKSDDQFAEAAPTLAGWLERGECTKKNANSFYSMIQASNNQIRRLFNEKMLIDEEFQALRSSFKDKFAHILLQFEQVAKILTAAKHQRVSDHFTKQQRRNIEMWLKMTEEVDNIREEFNIFFDDEDQEKAAPGKNTVPLEKYEKLKMENENMAFELEGYKNEAHLAKTEAERKFEKFKAHFVAQQALHNNQSIPIYPPLPPPPMPSMLSKPPLPSPSSEDPKPPPPSPSVPPSEAKLISMLSMFLLVHPQGATLDYLVSYIKSMIPYITQTTVLNVLNKYSDVFRSITTGVGSGIEHKWSTVTYDMLKLEK